MIPATVTGDEGAEPALEVGPHDSVGAPQSVAFLFSCSDRVMDEFLNCAKQTNSPNEAIKLVKLAVSLGLSSAHRLKSRAEKEFELSESQR